jgi:hypothetical protein
LGEMFPAEKKLSRRRRKTFGNEDALAWSAMEGCGDASDGTRSSMSSLRLIAASVSDVTGVSASMAKRMFPLRRILLRRQRHRRLQTIMLARIVKENQGDSDPARAHGGASTALQTSVKMDHWYATKSLGIARSDAQWAFEKLLVQPFACRRDVPYMALSTCGIVRRRQSAARACLWLRIKSGLPSIR